MRIYIGFFISILAIVFTSCRNDFEFQDYESNLSFSKQTVYLDTVFSNISSSTYRLKVYNNSDNDIVIPTLRLKKGVNSKFRIMVDGLSGEDHNNDNIGDGKIFYNVEMLAKDSMFVFIEVTSSVQEANPTDFLYTDEIEFIAKNQQVQKVDLVTLVQDAVFIYPERQVNGSSYLYESVNLGLNNLGTPVNVLGSELSTNDPLNGNELTWTNAKPYVIYGYAVVPNGQTLVINKGARVHFHANSGLLVNRYATLQVNGEKDIVNSSGVITQKNEVTFEGDRLEPFFSEIPGQWSAIIHLSENNNNWIKYATIKNASIGLLLQSYELMFHKTPTTFGVPKIDIENSQIYNHSNIGILGRKAEINGKNLVFNNCGESSLACTQGGTYNFIHCTINNSFSSTKQTALVLNNYLKLSETTFNYNDLNANLYNCIIYGNNSRNIFLDKKNEAGFVHNFNHCLIKFNSDNVQLVNPELYNFTSTNYVNCSIATNSTINSPKYKNVSRNQLWVTQNLGLPHNLTFSNFNDINNTPRTSNVNLGAYQTIP